MNTEIIQKLEYLSRLSVGEDLESRELFQKKMESVLSYINTVLENADESSANQEKTTSPMVQINRVRGDIAVEPDDAFRDMFLKNAPSVEHGFIKVAKVL